MWPRHCMAALHLANVNLFQTILSQNHFAENILESGPTLNQNQNRLEFQDDYSSLHYSTEAEAASSNIGSIQENSDDAFIKFLKAIVTTVIAIILSHLWYIDQRDDDARQERNLTESLHEFTRNCPSQSRLQNNSVSFSQVADVASPPKQKYKPHKPKHSSKSGRNSRYNKRSLAYRQNNLECITESEDEALAELSYLSESSLAANNITTSCSSLSALSLPSSDEEHITRRAETKSFSSEPDLVNDFDLHDFDDDIIDDIIDYVIEDVIDDVIECVVDDIVDDNDDFIGSQLDEDSNAFDFSLSLSTSVEKEAEVTPDTQVDPKVDLQVEPQVDPEIDLGSLVDMSRDVSRNNVSFQNDFHPELFQSDEPETTDIDSQLLTRGKLTSDSVKTNPNNPALIDINDVISPNCAEMTSEFEIKTNFDLELIELQPRTKTQTETQTENRIETNPETETKIDAIVYGPTIIAEEIETEINKLRELIHVQNQLVVETESEPDNTTAEQSPHEAPPAESEIEKDFPELTHNLLTQESEIQNEEINQHFSTAEFSSHLPFQDLISTNSESQFRSRMPPSLNHTPTNTLTSPYYSNGGYPPPYQKHPTNSVNVTPHETLSPQTNTTLYNGNNDISRSPIFNDTRTKSPNFAPTQQMNGKHSPPRATRSKGDEKRKPAHSSEEKKIVIANELTEADKRRTSIAEAYPYIKDESNSSKVVIGITRDESFLKHKQVTDKVLTDLQELQQEFEESQRNFSSHRISFDSEEKAGTSFSFEGNLNASCVSSNDRIILDGLSKHDMKTHKDISFRRKTQESTSSDDNYSVSTREMLDDITDVVVMIRCRYKPCGKIRELKIARTCYKMCHNCFTYYCSKTCREHHWERHKIKCVYSRVNSTCKNILNSIRHVAPTLTSLCEFAEAEYNMNGRGAILVKFQKHADAENFVRSHDPLPDLEYITLSKLDDPELIQLYFADIVSTLHNVISSYDPLSKIVVIIAVDINAYKESNQKVIPRVTSRYMCKYLSFRHIKDFTLKPEGATAAPKERPKALVATSMVKQNSFNTQKDRKLFFSNLQRNLKNKGVNIRVDFPFVYQQLCKYVETGEHFEPITLYPHDPATGQQFMCLIMPDSQPNFLSWVSETT